MRPVVTTEEHAMRIRELCLAAVMSGLLLGALAPASAATDDAAPGATTSDQAAVRALAERRQKMIERCERDHGVDCEREVDTELRAEALPSGAWLIRLEPERTR